MSDKPLVSIIVRTKDRPKLLKRALESVASQTYRPIEVVLVNDGGCDLDIEELKGIPGNVSLNYIRLEKNMGRAHAGTVGIQSAKGEYIGFLDDDDEFYPEHVETLVGYLQQSDLKVAYTDSLMVYKEYNPQTQEIHAVKKELVYSQDFDYDLLLFENYIPFMCLLFAREVLINSGGLDSSFELYEDYDLLIRLGEKFPFYHIRKTTADYCQWCSASQISQRNVDVNLLRESYLRLFSKHIDKFIPKRIYNYRAKKYIELTAKLSHIKNLETLIRDKDNQLRDLQNVIRGKDQVIRGKDQYVATIVGQLHQKDVILSNIYNSRGWKALSIYYKLRDKLLPADSLRRGFVKGIFRALVFFQNYLFKKKQNRLMEG